VKRVILVFFGTLVGGFVLFGVLDHFHAIANARRFGEAIGWLAVSFAIAAGWDESRRRVAKKRQARCGTDTMQVPHVEGVRGVGPLGDAEGHPIVFKPYRKPMLIIALLVAGIGVSWALGVGMRRPICLSRTVKIPGPLPAHACFVVAALYFGLYIRSRLPRSEITVDTAGIILPGRRRVTWDRIAEVKLCNAEYAEFLAIVRISLTDGRRVSLIWYQTGCKPRKLYDAIQTRFEHRQRQAESLHPGTGQRDDPVHASIGVHSR